METYTAHAFETYIDAPNICLIVEYVVKTYLRHDIIIICMPVTLASISNYTTAIYNFQAVLLL